ncbi:hypothetical protein COCHEDRAFT_1215972 [Bipolaris maydis C5]|uniref:Uncharacterized protein n=1 Tax=Cochliobolus heterostrophus (strain C5 / ATCC 48332 / race O) TaxID=701091 RepID=M2UMP8_COCH5|nr:hypothetical protein COCHEDRAFT_1215972 [Bipolaris maydis C5]KAJ5024874.1 hypothetical protein J3E73DRAFT_397600 [Bipolaris maydis]KAJ5057089.1 hypothetical protein J3E74DRAFT_293521 [Bipolaris maydis]KAJ6194380.1 hypothetical protein J3E72DRAFT_377993 [Bipolaris maydis]KAJ6212577.1 hypothetical protein PSV09DRAFT_1215972 [Bipolaris maydis]
MASGIQIELIRAWSRDIGHVVDAANSPKAEFARLAKAKGWEGGNETWRSRWKECFKEEYPYGQRRQLAREDKTEALEDGGIHLEDRMRRLSIVSDTSSFSVISRADSFDSVRSFDSHESFEDLGAVVDVPVPLNPASVSETNEYRDPVESERKPSLSSSECKADSNPAWIKFTNFVHSPTAPFKSEFERLAHIKNWTGSVKRQQFVSLLSSEVAFYWGTDGDTLEQYQEMCRDLGLTHIPSTVTQCKKILDPLKINLFTVIDNKRNPKIKIVQYESLSKLRKSIRKSGCFPRDAAKAGGGCFRSLLCRL